MLISGGAIAALGVGGYATWPRLEGYEEEVERQRRLLEAGPEITEFVRMATLAANGHNTQPWKFEIEENLVRIHPDLTRRTEIVDPDDHHLFVSLGCAAENLAIAAAAFGKPCDVRIREGAQSVIDIALQNGPDGRDELYKAIPHRQSTRSVFDGQAISKDDLSLLTAAAEEEGVSLNIFTEATQREQILEFVVEGNTAQMEDPAFVAELRDWLRFSPQQALSKNDGLFGACSGNPVVPGWLGSQMFGAFFTKDTENDKYRDHIRSSAGIAVFTGDRADPEHWIKVGRSFQRFALQATSLGIRNAHINQPIEVSTLRSEFANWLGAPEARPDLIVRFGRAPALPYSLRRPVEAVLI
jgi:hypothetical protein